MSWLSSSKLPAFNLNDCSFSLGQPSTDGGDPNPCFSSSQFINQGHQNSDSTCTDRMADGDGSPINIRFFQDSINLLRIPIRQDFCADQGHGSKGLVDLNEVGLIEGDGCIFKSLLNGKARNGCDQPWSNGRCDRGKDSC